MARVAEGIGKNYEEAVNDALSKIGLKKEEVSIEMIEEPKKRIFSILEHKQVKVRVTELEQKIEKTESAPSSTAENKREVKELTEEDAKIAEERVIHFLNEFFEKMGLTLNIKPYVEEGILKFDVTGENAGIVIGYRGETMEALQMLAGTIANKETKNHVRIVIDIEGYRKKRIKALEELALKRANAVVAKRKSITLEPMSPFERKAIHSALQNHPKVKTVSTGVEPYRKVVISLK
ncbi:MAG: KH domain-containing protein [Clostridia bacterium]|nr:KH domain-containing protein [Clostridia bacterium]